ncbi:MAG: mevalonate kinase, partial [Anaerolineae bacterium]
ACTHGTPSGIDNTVVALGRPIRFQAGEAEPLDVGAPLTLVVGDTGRHGATSDMVAGVARRRHERPRTYETWFADIARFVDQASGALASGENVRVGWLLDRNHLILQAMRVSTSELDALVAGARRAGALGAKMTGAGGGGVVIAVVTPEIADEVAEAMRLGGAVRTWRTTVPPTDALGRRQSDDRGGP